MRKENPSGNFLKRKKYPLNFENEKRKKYPSKLDQNSKGRKEYLSKPKSGKKIPLERVKYLKAEEKSLEKLLNMVKRKKSSLNNVIYSKISKERKPKSGRKIPT